MLPKRGGLAPKTLKEIMERRKVEEEARRKERKEQRRKVDEAAARELKKREAEELVKEDARRQKEAAKKAKVDLGTFVSAKQKQELKEQEDRLVELAAQGLVTLKEDQKTPELLAKVEAEKEKLMREKDRIANKAREKEKVKEKEREKEKELERQQDGSFRAPICCVLGHVDTGKTMLLDKIRQTNVQSGEAGGITQQIGATFFPIETILKKTECLNEEMTLAYRIPGLLIIDTPGHATFTNLRKRGSSLCDIAILVVDIMHGLELQTKEAIRLLCEQERPFIVALNKVDRLFDWKRIPDGPFRVSLAAQPGYVQQQFDTLSRQVIDELRQEGLNSELYWENKELRKCFSIVPISAKTGEGIPDLLMLMTRLTQRYLAKPIAVQDTLQCVVLEVKVVEGLGHTIDVILVNGELHEGDTILLGGLHGPIMTHIRALLTPPPLKEIRVKNEYVHHKSIRAAQGVKICAQDLEHAVAGSQLLVVPPTVSNEELDKMRQKVMDNILDAIVTRSSGVSVQASTLGSLEALMAFLGECKPPIPVCTVNIGPVHKKDVVKCRTMLETKSPEYAVILAFDVQVSRDILEFADKEGVRIFQADIIYHLFDMFTAYIKDVEEKRKKEQLAQAIFPVELRIVPGCVFRAKDPILLGVEVVTGVLRLGTPLCTILEDKSACVIGTATSIEVEHQERQLLTKGQQGAVKITPRDPTITVGR
eukprot:RCo003302